MKKILRKLFRKKEQRLNINRREISEFNTFFGKANFEKIRAWERLMYQDELVIRSNFDRKLFAKIINLKNQKK